MLERAAVVGRHFSRAAVAELLPREAGDLDARLEALRRSELIEPDTGWFLGEPALRFHHALIRDAAYRRVLKGTRAELHARLADWIERRVGDAGAARRDDRLASRAGAPAPARARTARRRRAARSASAPRATSRRQAGGRWRATTWRVAANLLGRALDRLDEQDPARAELALDRCEALLAAGDVAPAVNAIAELARFSSGSDRLRAWHTCFAAPARRADGSAGAARQRGRGSGCRRSAGGAGRRRRRGQGALRARAGARASGQGRRLRGRARSRARRGAARARPPARERGAVRCAARRAVGTLPGHARQRPLPRRRARAAHHAGSARGRGRRTALSGGARGAARSQRCGAAHDRLLAAHGRRARPHAAAARDRRLLRADRPARRATSSPPSAACAAPIRGCETRGSASTRREPPRCWLARCSRRAARQRPRP